MRKLFISLFFVCFLGLYGCSEKSMEAPFSDNKIIEILKDVHVINGALQRQTGALKDSLEVVYYDQLFAIHEIDKGQFDQLLSYFESNPEEAKRLYGELLEKLTMDIEKDQ